MYEHIKAHFHDNMKIFMEYIILPYYTLHNIQLMGQLHNMVICIPTKF